MLTRHTAILKANQGELTALRNLDASTARKITPMFEIGRVTESIRESKWYKNSPAPTIAYLDRVIGGIGRSWLRSCMVDGYQWRADARTENGEHVIAYMVTQLRALEVPVIPVVGYDRWGNAEYRAGIQSIIPPDDGHYCLRLDSVAIEDSAEPDHFQETVSSIVEDLDLEPRKCSILLDFADISTNAASIESMAIQASRAINLLRPFGFRYYIVAGCSLPKTINLAVGGADSVGSVLRKEMLIWQMLRQDLPKVHIVSGDYGVRGPTTTEIRSSYTNGKIRHTIKNQTFVARGHAFKLDGNYTQMYGLSSTIIKSPHFLGEGFSWGNSQIVQSSRKAFLGSLSHWIAIDTNHHLTFVVQEVEEFERDFVLQDVDEDEDA
jgi:hypothetical protein